MCCATTLIEESTLIPDDTRLRWPLELSLSLATFVVSLLVLGMRDPSKSSSRGSPTRSNNEPLHDRSDRKCTGAAFDTDTMVMSAGCSPFTDLAKAAMNWSLLDTNVALSTPDREVATTKDTLVSTYIVGWALGRLVGLLIGWLDGLDDGWPDGFREGRHEG